MSNKFPMMSAEIGPIPETEFTKPRSRFVKLNSIRSSKSKGGEDEKKKQIHDYVVWVNSYLKCKPGAPLITDLKIGMQDGIAIVNLVEAAANADIPFVNRKPSSSSARKANIEKAIAFLKSDGANVTGDPAKDISDGNIKGMMKIILTVAEKYNPRSVRPIVQPKLSSGSSSSSQHPHSHTSQSLTTPSGIGRSPERGRENHTLSTSPRGTSPVPQSQPFQQSRSYSQSDPHSQSYPHSPGSYPHGQSHPHSQFHLHPHSHQHPLPLQAQQLNSSSATRPQQGFALSQGYALSQGFGSPQGIPGDLSTEGGMGGVGFSLSQPVTAQSEDIYTDPVDSLPKNVTQRIYNHMSGNRLLGHKPPGKTHNNRLSVPSAKPQSAGIPEGTVAKEVKSVDPGKPDTTQKPPPDNSLVYGEINGTLSGLSNLKIELLKLHTVLLDNVGDDEMKEGTIDMKLPLEVANSEIMTRDKVLSELQADFDKIKEALAKSESECEALKDMVMERNQFITGMKTEIYRKEYRNDTEKVDLQTQVLHKDRKIKILEGELNLMKASVEGKDREVVDMRKKRAELEVRENELRDEMTQITSELTRAVEGEESLQAKLFSRDWKITHLEEKLEIEKGVLQRINPTIVSEEMESIREMFMGLRESMDAKSSNQQALDSLEKTISNMITKFTDHVRSISPNRKPRRHHDEKREERKKRHRERGESRSSRDEVDRGHHSFSSSNPGDWTKVFYYITGDKMETPYVTSVPRKTSEVRLKDFKAVFDRHGFYRFYFKTEDPDCGVVREEIVNDDHILPAWNGKIMVWVTEKAHHR